MSGKTVRSLSGALCAWALLVSPALAVDYTWNVNGPTNGWSRTSTSIHKNWNAGVAFPFAYGVDAFFGPVADGPIFVVDGVNVRNITFGSSQVINNTGGGILYTDTEDRVITVTNAADIAVIDATMNGNFGFTKAGPGTLSIGGTNSINRAILNEGTLRLTNGKAVGGVTVNSGTILELNLATNTINSSISGTGTINVVGTSASAIEMEKLSTFQGTLNVTATGTGKFVTRSTLGANAVVNVASGSTLQIDSSSTMNNLFISGTGNSEGYGALRVDYTLAGVVNLLGPTSFSSSYNSTILELSAKVTGNYPLTTATTWGRTQGGKVPGFLHLTSPESDYPSLTIDNVDAVIAVGASATLVSGVVQKGPLGTGTVSFKAGTLVNSPNGSSNIDNPLEITGTATKALNAAGSALNVRSNITGDGSTLIVSDNFSPGVILSGNNSGFTGKFTVGLTGQSFYYDTVVLNSTTAGSAVATWDLRGNLRVGFAGDGTVQLGALAGERTAEVYNSYNTATSLKTLNVGALNTDSIFRGEFNATTFQRLGLVKVGTGTLRMVPEETSTLTSMVINEGRVLVNTASTGSNPTAYFNGPVTVNAGATLGGTGSLTSAITLNSGSTIAPGDGVGTLTTIAQTWAGGTHFEQQMSSQGGSILGTTFDVLLMNNGNLNLSAVSASNPVVIDLISMSNTTTPGLISSWNPNNSATWQGFIRIPFGGSITSFSADKFVFDTSDFQNPLNGSFSVVQVNPIQLNLVYTANPIPEPSTVVLLAGSGVGLFFCRRRKK